MKRTYYVTYAQYTQSGQNLSSDEITIDVESGDTPGMIAKKLESGLSEKWDSLYSVVINFWQM